MNKAIDISNVILKTERLILRPWTENDIDDLYEYASVEGVGIWAGWLPHKNREESESIARMFIEHKKVFAIEYQGKVIGSLGIESYGEDDFPQLEKLQAREIGFVLSKAYWGKGLMTEAVKEVIRYCFEDEKLDALTCCYYVGNERSARVQTKCGFKFFTDSIHETTFGEKREAKCNLLTKEEFWELWK